MMEKWGEFVTVMGYIFMGIVAWMLLFGGKISLGFPF
jgi:hypothetical protein